MWIKICASTNLEDALLAADLGADAVGFVFAPSPRQVTPVQAAAIVAQLPSYVEKVGVFPAWPADRIAEAVEQAGLTTIQLHGTPDSELACTLHGHFASRVGIIQVVHWKIDAPNDQSKEIAQHIKGLTVAPEIDRILIDSKVNSSDGGTGMAFPWNQARLVFALHSKVILAGGLNPNNIREAIQQLKPWGVDVASGVESSLGKKDSTKLQAFIKAARAA